MANRSSRARRFSSSLVRSPELTLAAADASVRGERIRRGVDVVYTTAARVHTGYTATKAKATSRRGFRGRAAAIAIETPREASAYCCS